MLNLKLRFDGSHLKALRKTTPYSQERMAELLDLSRETVSAIENNKDHAIRNLSIEMVNKWQHVCESHVDANTKQSFVGHLRKVLGI